MPVQAAWAAFIIAVNNQGSFLSDTECVTTDDITGLAYSGEIIKTHIHAGRGGGTPGLGGSLSWCNQESSQRFPVLG